MDESPYKTRESSRIEHYRLVNKGREIAVTIKKQCRNRGATLPESAVAWGNPPQAPYYGTSINIDRTIMFLEELLEDLKQEEIRNEANKERKER